MGREVVSMLLKCFLFPCIKRVLFAFINIPHGTLTLRLLVLLQDVPQTSIVCGFVWLCVIVCDLCGVLNINSTLLTSELLTNSQGPRLVIISIKGLLFFDWPSKVVKEKKWAQGRCVGFDHIDRNPPVLIRTPKLTRSEPAQYWGGGPPGNSVVLNPFFFSSPPLRSPFDSVHYKQVSIIFSSTHIIV